MNIKYISLFVVLLVTVTRIIIYPVYAVDINGLYEAEVPVFNQGAKQRKQAIRSGLLEVLIKVSGSSEIPLTPGLPELLDKADRYVQQFRYRNWPVDRPIPQEFEGNNVPKRLLWARYDKQAVNKILQDQGFPIWGRSRPAVLIWLALESEGDRFLLGNDSDAALNRLFQHEAKKRGLPILFPLLDLQDQASIRVFDVWGDFQEEILQASRRYETKAILSGRLYRDEFEGWQAKWTLYEGGNRTDWASSGSSQEFILADAIEGVTSVLSAKYAQIVDMTSKDSIYISVRNVNSLADYARIARYLASLALVERASAVEFRASNAKFRLDINGAEQGVIRTIDLGNILIAEQQDQSSIDSQSSAQTTPESTDRVYRLLR